MSTDRRHQAAHWFEALRDRICAAFERLEDDYAGPLAQNRPSDSIAPGI